MRIYAEYMEKISYLNHDVFQFADKKYFHLGDMLKLRIRADPLIGTAPRVVVPQGINLRIRFNVFACARIDHANNSYFNCIIIEENGMADIFCKFVMSLLSSRFTTVNNVMVCDNYPIHAGGEAGFITENLEDLGIYALLLTKHAPELNPTELVFYTFVLRLKNINVDIDTIYKEGFSSYLNDVAQTINVDDVLKYYWKCGSRNFNY